MIKVNVNSEIGKLKKVLVHRPGKEVENLYPELFQTILFDDIMYLEKAQQEHDFFTQALKEEGIEVFYIENLVAQVLDKTPSLKEKFIDDFLNYANITSSNVLKACKDFFMKIEDNLELVKATIAGIRKTEISPNFSSSLIDQTIKENTSYPFYIKPIPNILFQRDPIASVFNSMFVNNMHSQTRKREKVYYEYGLMKHPDFKDIDYIKHPKNAGQIEGGDIMVVSKNVLFIGLGERTCEQGIDFFAKEIFKKYQNQIKSIIALKIPKSHATMHLDTLFTQIDHDKFLVSPNLFEKDCEFFLIEKNHDENSLRFTKHFQSIENIIKNFINQKAILIKIGANERVVEKREQWNDATNSLCIAPGKCIVYDRNYVTNKMIKDQGVSIIEIKSSELSKGRGGPRCMSMPLEREDF